VWVFLSGGWWYASGQPASRHTRPTPVLHEKAMPTLKPSITEMSYESMAPPIVNSASVIGGCPDRVQEKAPPQSPVVHRPLPPLKEHPVRPHTLPDWVPAGTVMVQVPPGLSCAPPPTGVAAGHTMKLHLLVMVKVAALAPATKAARRRKTTEEQAAIDASYFFCRSIILSYVLSEWKVESYISTYRRPGRMRIRKVEARKNDQNTFVDSSMWRARTTW
jgi:hypothetical protein